MDRRTLIHRTGMAARWALLAVLLLLAAIGFFYVTRGTAVRHVRGVGADGAPVAPEEPQFPLSVAVLTGTVLSGGNRVELALDGDGTFPRLWDDLRSARRSITIQSYYGAPGHVADTLRAILVERAAAGVRILVLYDAFGTQDMPDESKAALRRAGVTVVPFRPLRLSTLNVLQNRSHVRGIVIDGRVGWTGGFGVDDKWLGDGHTNGGWRDTNVRFEGPAVRQLQAAFTAAWTEATGVMLTGRGTVDRYEGGVATAGLLNASPTLGSTAAERFLALSIAGARRTLYVTNAYFAPDANFVTLLAEAARRGVDVRLLVAGPRTDIRLARTAGRARYPTLLAAGVRIYEWQPTTLHAKTFVVDGRWSSVGTMNFDNRSLALNDEVTLMVLDPAFGQRMDAIFLDDLRHAVEIRAERFARRPWYEHVAEWGATLVTRLL
ncbi:MAG TPA: phospholipase D-like domain-containing protein [Gemmatimonadaceae bacterium]|jgi:cardiolipin synthase